MSLLFDGEQTTDQPVWTEPTLAEHEDAIARAGGTPALLRTAAIREVGSG